MNVKLKHHLIEKYRESIKERYNYDNLKGDPKLPPSFSRDIVNEMQTFFLDNLYSAPAERERLDAAFIQLESFIYHTSEIWGVLGSLPSAIFQFGFHFPTAIKAAASALETHTSARHFEDTLLQAAIDKKYTVPLSDEQFRECLAAIPPKQAKDFIGDLSALFHIITDTALLAKTILIMQDVLHRMKEKKDLYVPKDKDAIQMGINLFKKSYELLEMYDEKVKDEIVEFVVYNETRFIEGLHKKRKTITK